MNILVVHEVDWMRKVVFDVHWISEAMSLRGHNVHALYYESLWGLNGWKPPRHTLALRAFPDAKVELICPSFIRYPIVSRASAFVTHYFEIKRVIKEKQIDAIILYSVPTNGLQSLFWAKYFNIPVIFRSIDVLSQLAPYPALRTITRLLERQVYSRVDRILTITPKLSEYVVRLGADSRKVNVLPVPVDINLFHPSLDGVSELRHKWGLSDTDKVVVYMGTLFNFSGLDWILPEFARKGVDAKLMIVGDGEQRGRLEQIIRAYNLHDEVIITGFQPYQDIPKYINLADVCINPFVVNDATRDIFPGKTVQILACGKPLVMRSLDGVKAMIDGEEQGVVYADSNEGIVREILSLLKSDEKRKKIGQNGLQYAKKHHDCREVARRLEGILSELV